MQKILLAGDCHGSFTPLLEAGHEADAIILLGDQTPGRDLTEELGPLTAKTWWIYGNHDSDDERWLMAHQSMRERCLHRRVVNFKGVRVAGLNGVFRTRYIGLSPDDRLNDLPYLDPLYRTRAEYIHARQACPRLETSIFPEDLEAMSRMRADVLVTHEAPESHRFGFRMLGDLARAMRVRLMVHAHHHERSTGFLDGFPAESKGREVKGMIRVVGLDMPSKTGVSTENETGMAWLHDLMPTEQERS